MCLACGGYGIVPAELTEQDAELGTVSKSVVCRACGGTGRVPEEQHAAETGEVEGCD